MSITRRVLDKSDLEHLLRGGAIRIKDSDTEICLADMGYSVIANTITRAINSESLVGSDIVKVL